MIHSQKRRAKEVSKRIKQTQATSATSSIIDKKTRLEEE